MRISPIALQQALVAKLRSIPAFVAEFNEDPTRILSYKDVYPHNGSLAEALYHLAAPGCVVAWQGFGPTSFGQFTQYAHTLSVYLRSGEDVEDPEGSLGRMFMALVDGRVRRADGSEGRQIMYEDSGSWAPGVHLETNELFNIQRQQDAEGRDFFEVQIIIREL